MKRRDWLQIMTIGGVGTTLGSEKQLGNEQPVIEVRLDPKSPSKSVGSWQGAEPFQFPVGFGRDGYREAGEAFVGGSSLLGDFRVNAILSAERFEMEDKLVALSGQSREWLEHHLFANMSSIDFDGDGAGGEYGDAFISLEPADQSMKQPFHFGEYRGVYRWYSYALHGTQDEVRVGQRVTGGCLNVSSETLEKIVPLVSLGDLVRVRGVEAV